MFRRWQHGCFGDDHQGGICPRNIQSPQRTQTLPQELAIATPGNSAGDLLWWKRDPYRPFWITWYRYFCWYICCLATIYSISYLYITWKGVCENIILKGPSSHGHTDTQPLSWYVFIRGTCIFNSVVCVITLGVKCHGKSLVRPWNANPETLTMGRISRLIFLSMFQTSGSKVEMAIPWLSTDIYPTFFLVLRSLQNLLCFNEFWGVTSHQVWQVKLYSCSKKDSCTNKRTVYYFLLLMEDIRRETPPEMYWSL